MLPHIVTALPGPRAQELIARDAAVLSPSYTRPYPLVAERGEGAIVHDVDGNRFLDFNAGIAVVEHLLHDTRRPEPARAVVDERSVQVGVGRNDRGVSSGVPSHVLGVEMPHRLVQDRTPVGAVSARAMRDVLEMERGVPGRFSHNDSSPSRV